MCGKLFLPRNFVWRNEFGLNALLGLLAVGFDVAIIVDINRPFTVEGKGICRDPSKALTCLLRLIYVMKRSDATQELVGDVDLMGVDV